jgi:hypothetical protein
VTTTVKARPPCPTKGGEPPGHAKVTSAPARPCGNGGAKDNGRNNGIVVLLPLVLGGLVASGRRRLVTAARRRGDAAAPDAGWSQR